jgi:DNA-binding beta-propeller fold protein YncE
MSHDTSRDFSRRAFLRVLGAGVPASTVAAHSIYAALLTSKADPLILGAGNHKYEWVRGWGKLPDGMSFGSTHGAVQVDAQNRVYFNTDTENAIIVFDQDGKFIKSFGKEWKADKEGNGTHGMQIVKEGRQEFIYLTNLFRHEFAKLTIDGEVVWVKGYPEKSGVYQNKDQFRPTGIAVAPTGDFYVTDGYGANYIHRYNAKGEYVSSWGGRVSKENPKEDGKFNTPHAIIIDTRGKEPLVLVTDRANHRLQWFSLEGQHLKTLDGTENDQLRLPATLHIRGTDLAIGDLGGRVTILDRENKLVAHLGDQVDPRKRATNKLPREQWLDGVFVSPHGICWDRQGNLYVEEWMAVGRVVKLKRVK